MNPNGYQPNPQGYPGGPVRRPAPNPGDRQQPHPNGAYGPRPGAQPRQPAYGAQPHPQSGPRPQSRFTGGLLGLIGIGILQWLLTFITFGLGVPWAVCIRERWLAEHTVIDGRQLYFDGKGSQLFGNYIKWFLLTLITLGIYGFWLNIKMRQWVTMHTHMR